MTAAVPHSVIGCTPAPAAVWRAGFRPFYLLGPLFGIVALALWAAARWGGADVPHGLPVWHGHEMLYGFAGALAGGFVLTAVPSWTGTPAVSGRPLALLAGAWLLGRIAVLLAPALPVAAVAVADLLYMTVLIGLVAPGVLAASDRRYRLLLPMLAWLCAGNLLFHAGAALGRPELAEFGVWSGLYGFMLLYSFVAGLLTPVFTEATLRGRGVACTAAFSPVLEWAAPLTVLALAVADLGGLGTAAERAAAAAAVVAHALRMVRWRPWAVWTDPLMLAMNLGYACFVLGFALHLAGAPASAAVHVFTVGAMGLTKLSLMTRVVLKHTGRPVRAPGWAWTVCGALPLVTAARLAAAWGMAPDAALAVSALVWAASMGGYLALFGRMLATPSLPYAAPRPSAAPVAHQHRRGTADQQRKAQP